MKRSLIAGLILLAGAANASSSMERSALSLDQAVKASRAAVAQCETDGFKVSAAVVDRSGVVLSLARHPAAGPHTFDSSRRKAYTSASLKESTLKLAGIAAKPELRGLHHMNDQILILGGGLPIYLNKQLVGAIGVGGAPGAHLDEACAKAGLKVIGASAHSSH